MSYSGIYTIDLSTYKELKLDMIFPNYQELNMIAREMIYYIHFTNIIMNSFLSSNLMIEEIIPKTSIISLDDYMNGADLI